MLIKNETKTYIILTVLCLVGVSLLRAFLRIPQISHHSLIQGHLVYNIHTIKKHFIPLILIMLLYFTFIIFGIVNLIIFIIRKLNNKCLLDLTQVPTHFSTTDKDTSMLLFSIVYFYTVISLVSIILFSQNAHNQYHSFSNVIFLNFVFELFVIFAVFKVISIKSLGIGINRSHILAVIKFYPATAVVTLTVGIALVALGRKFNFFPHSQAATYIFLALKNKWLLSLFILEIAFVGPLAEELLFRGFFYKFLRKRCNWAYSAVITSLLFAFLHNNLFGFFVIFIISMAICYLYEKTQNIVVAFLFHSLHNSLSIIGLLVIKQLTAG